MSMRLLFKLAGPVPSLKKRAAPVRCLLNTARYPLKTRYRHATAYNTEKVHRPSKIRRATQHTEAMFEYYAMYQSRPFANIFVANISAPLFGSDSRKFSVAKILRRTGI